MGDLGDVMAWAIKAIILGVLLTGVAVGGCTACVALRYTAHVSIERRP